MGRETSEAEQIMSEIKLCKDCKHFIMYGTYGSYCGIGKTDLVHGEPCERCFQARTINGSCGVEAKNFEQKPEPVKVEQPHIADGYKIVSDLPNGSKLLAPIDEPRPWWKFWGKA